MSTNAPTASVAIHQGSPAYWTSATTAVAIGLALYIAGALAGLVAWIGGLIKTGQINRWGWFITVLLLPALGSLLYGLAGLTQRKTWGQA